MKMVVAIVRPERLQCVKDALRDHGINGMTITHVTGRGEQMGLKFTNRVGEFIVDEIEKIKIETVVEDSQVDGVVAAIQRVANTGHPGRKDLHHSCGEVYQDQDRGVTIIPGQLRVT